MESFPLCGKYHWVSEDIHCWKMTLCWIHRYRFTLHDPAQLHFWATGKIDFSWDRVDIDWAPGVHTGSGLCHVEHNSGEIVGSECKVMGPRRDSGGAFFI